MQSNLYIGLSAQKALMKRLDSVANNIANASTAGFRAEQISFEEVIAAKGKDPVSFVSKGQDFISTKTGDVTQTGNPLDVAVRGSAWLAIQTSSGTAYTRDGRMQMRADGVLTTITGQPFLDAGGAPMQLDPKGPTPEINKAGTVIQGKSNVGALGLYRMPRDAKLTRAEGVSVTSSVPAVPELDFLTNGVMQGFIEKSNVNPILEMTHLISIQRNFEAVTNMMQQHENSVQDGLKALGGS